ncbi:low quality protein: [Lynx pardinus]|uniref:Low quality protein n=1 Tax=Lynx pardinus TaxID=191816 RepID=A0A485P631_LYNPA|nr:low quality protein: [Lynx pardinus]
MPVHNAHRDPRGSLCSHVFVSVLTESPCWVFVGESLVQVQRRLLKDKELKIRKALDRLREKRRLLGRQRRRREFPVVSMVGYTNCDTYCISDMRRTCLVYVDANHVSPTRVQM